MIMPGDFVIAGVSGGADSVCLFVELLAYQKEIPFSMEVVHIEHGIRGRDSLADANYVENLCKEYGVPFHLVSCDIKKMAQESSLTVEESWRKARYQAFEPVSYTHLCQTRRREHPPAGRHPPADARDDPQGYLVYPAAKKYTALCDTPHGKEGQMHPHKRSGRTSVCSVRDEADAG